MSFIRQFIDRLYQKDDSDHYRLTFVGVDCSGKTTLLYLLKEQREVTVIPTIGFNTEDFIPPSLSDDPENARKPMTGWDVGTGCGMEYIMGIIEMYIREGDALVWMVDSTDRERLPQSREYLGLLLQSLQDPSKEPKPSMPILMYVLPNPSCSIRN